MSVDVAVATRRRQAPGGALAERLARSAACVPADAAAVEAWLAARTRRNPIDVARVRLDRLAGWRLDPGTGDLVHESGRFFSVEGMRVQTDFGSVPGWSQPIIDQPERSVLGILVKELDGVLRFLMQAKLEPGNPGCAAQLSPTVQATPSNYGRAHRGRVVPYLEHFVEPGRARVLVDVLQSEQGSWFKGKRNRNVVMETTEDVEPGADFAWLTLGELYALLRRPNVVNMDARTVLSCLPLPIAGGAGGGDGGELHAALRRSAGPAGEDGALSPMPEVASWLTRRKAAYALSTQRVALRSVAGWVHSAVDVHHESGRFFTIVGVEVHATNREVDHWCQPLLAPRGEGLAAFVVRRFDGILHLLARADLRPGYRDVVELGPTVQCTPANFDRASPARPALLDVVLGPDAVAHYDVRQSEEGGRFDGAVTRHMVVEVDADLPLPADFAWLTLAQLKRLVAGSYQVNIEARSLAACMHAMDPAAAR